MRDGYRWLSKEDREERNRFILEKRAKGWTIEQISARTNLAPSGVRQVLYMAKKRAIAA